MQNRRRAGSTGDRSSKHAEKESKENPSRLREITQVLRKYKVFTRGITPEKLRLILEELGPTYVKLGQIMSLHSDILPKAYCDELMKLNSSVAPMPFSEVEEVLNNSFRGDWREIFESIEPLPIGSASIAQVHKAVLKNGDQVVVKVERKGIYDTMARDIRLMHRAVRMLPAVGNLRSVVDFDMVLDEMWSVAQEEMDFLKEASNMEEFARLNKDIAYIGVPRLYREYTTSRVLVMEYVDGIPIDDAETLKEDGYDLDEIGRKFVNNFIKQVMDDGFFHADPHPGNVMIRDGKIVWLDMGMMGRLTERDRRCMVKGIEGIAMQDVGTVESAVLELGDFWGPPDRDKLYRDLRNFIDKYGSTGMGDIDVAEVMQEVVEIMKVNKMSLPHGVSMLARGLTHMEGVLTSISPDINMVQIAAARVQETYIDKKDWKKEARHYARHAYRSFSKGIDIPSLTVDVLNEVLRGQTRVNLKLESSRSLDNLVNAAVRNIVIGLTIVALLVSSSIICTTDMEPKVEHIPLLGALGYFVALGSIAFFVIRYYWRKFRDSHPKKRKKHKG
ncbi:MAG: AarF/UbiB family protein [Lachnospiraceae bacterium]|nr:AarF/UbiB family protein [Lachnospiraceae bacterium]